MLCLFYSTLNAHPVLDSLSIWKEQQAFAKICSAADDILSGKQKGLNPCDLANFMIAASSAASERFEPTQALKYAQAAGNSKCKDRKVLMQATMHSATAYNLLMQLDSAILLTQTVIEFAEKEQDADLLTKANTNLGMMLNKKGQYEAARGAFVRASTYLDRTDMRRMAISRLNIALCYLNLKDYEKALITVDSALLFAKKAEVPPILAHTLGLKADILHAKKDLTLWESTLDSAIAISMQAGNTNQAAYGLIAKFDHYISSKNYPLALRFGNKALDILEKSDQYPLLLKNYKGFYKTYKAIGEPANALLFMEKYAALKDSLDNAQFSQKIHELNLKYEVAEKEKKIFQQSVEIRKNKIWLISIGFGAFVLATISFFFFWKNRMHKQNLQLLYQKERKLEMEVADLRKILPVEWSPSGKAGGNETETLNDLLRRTHLLMEKEKLYLNPEFNRDDLAQILGTNRSYLSQAINEVEEGGFRTLINKYRVNEAKSMIWKIAQKHSDQSLTKIWELVGFNSNQSFYRIFKFFTSLTPKEYLDQVILEIKEDKKTPISPSEE